MPPLTAAIGSVYSQPGSIEPGLVGPLGPAGFSGGVSLLCVSYTIFQPFGASPPVAQFLVYVDPRAVQLVSSSSDADPYGVDPRAVQLVSASSDADPFGVDPRAVQLVSASSDADPFGVDPRAVQLVQ